MTLILLILAQDTFFTAELKIGVGRQKEADFISIIQLMLITKMNLKLPEGTFFCQSYEKNF
jgi:hypothetical protein